MSVRKPVIRDGMYCGSITEQHQAQIMGIRNAENIPDLKKMIFNFPLEMIIAAEESGMSIREYIKANGIDPKPYIGELRDYQTVGTAFMYESPRSILGDGVGLGKTAQVAALLNVLRQKKQMTRFLMAVENSAVGQTYLEMLRFTGMRIVELPSTKAKMQKVITNTDWSKVDGIITKHSALDSDSLSEWLAKNLVPGNRNRIFDTFILDESSLIKNNETRRYTYIKNICNLCKRVHLLNATVFETNIMDIYYQIDMIDEYILPSKSRIEKDYCVMGKESFWTKRGGVAEMKWRYFRADYKNQEVFRESLKLVYFSRCKKDIGINTPHIYKVYEIEPSIGQVGAIGLGYNYSLVLNCPSNVPDANVPFTRKQVPKLDRLCELMSEEFGHDQVMIYCFHLNAQAVIKKELEKIGRKVAVLNGQVKDEDRYQLQDDFNTGVYDVLITNIKRSLNLYGGDVCILYSLEVNPSKMTQLVGRIDRNVDDKIKTFVLMLYNHTPEYEFFINTIKKRAKDSRELTVDAESAVDLFCHYMEEQE